MTVKELSFSQIVSKGSIHISFWQVCCQLCIQNLWIVAEAKSPELFKIYANVFEADAFLEFSYTHTHLLSIDGEIVIRKSAGVSRSRSTILSSGEAHKRFLTQLK